jgi:hypothetical protein
MGEGEEAKHKPAWAVREARGVDGRWEKEKREEVKHKPTWAL